VVLAQEKLLSAGGVLLVTPGLVQHARPELTMEHEIALSFNDDERLDAACRLAGARGHDG
jgi:hypothetical protein